MNYFDLLNEKAAQQPKKPLLHLEERSYAYEEIAQAAHRLAAALPLREKIVLIDAADPYFQLIAFLALQAAGNTAILSHADLPRPALRKLLAENGVGYLLADRPDALDASSISLPDGTLFTVDTTPKSRPDATLCMGALSSGSTGVPKLLLRTYESWAGFFCTQNALFRIDAQSILFLHGGLNFTGNLNALLSVLYVGGTIVWAKNFHCKTWLRRIRAHSVTTIYLVPAKLKTLEKVLTEPLPTVKMLFTGSQPLFAPTAATFQSMLPNGAIILYYGASELNYITYMTYESPAQNPLCVGKPFPGVGIFIEGDLIYVHTPYRADGVPNPATVHDAGYLDENEQLILLGRRQNIINKGGFKISCTKVEAALCHMPGVRQAAVLPYADAKKGCELAAFLIADETADRARIKKAVRAELMPAELPKKLRFLEELPLNDRGKPDTQALLALL